MIVWKDSVAMSCLIGYEVPVQQKYFHGERTSSIRHCINTKSILSINLKTWNGRMFKRSFMAIPYKEKVAYLFKNESGESVLDA